MAIWRFCLRLLVGGLMVGHGTQKLFGWFGGEGVRNTAASMEKTGLRPGTPHAIAAGIAEAGGGALLAAGLEPAVGAALVTGSMLTAIQRVHRPNGPWVQKGGYEYPVVLIALALGLVEAGPGALSIDRLLGRDHHGTAWAALAFGGGSLGAYLVDTLAGLKRVEPTRLPVSEPQRAAA
jgi:putative oxidoreductase